jgi:hypothetical protein
VGRSVAHLWSKFGFEPAGCTSPYPLEGGLLCEELLLCLEVDLFLGSGSSRSADLPRPLLYRDDLAVLSDPLRTMLLTVSFACWISADMHSKLLSRPLQFLSGAPCLAHAMMLRVNRVSPRLILALCSQCRRLSCHLTGAARGAPSGGHLGKWGQWDGAGDGGG